MSRFNKIYIEITNVCNLKCSFCSPTNRVQTFMKEDDFEAILQQLQGICDIIYLHVKGEPLLHPRFKEILSLCATYNMRVHLTTNATLLKQHLSLIKHSNVVKKIHISLHCEQNESTYFTRVFHMANALYPIDIVYRIWTLQKAELDENNKKLLDEIVCFYKLHAVYDQLLLKKNFKIKDHVYIDQANEFIWPSLNNAIMHEEGYCYALKTHVGILSDGSVVPCCLDGEGIQTLGNIHTQSFINIIESDQAKFLRKQFQDRKIKSELCKRCGFLHRIQRK